MNYLINLSDGTNVSETSMGGKAKSLSNLLAMGINVPSGFCLTSEAFLSHCKKNGVLDLYEELHLIEPSNPERIKILAQIRKRILIGSMTDDIENAIRYAWEQMGDVHIAVRSSCVGEDSYDKSYAGIFSSYLHISSFSELVQAVRKVWKSVFSEQAMYYHQDLSVPRMAVIIQRMIKGYYSGVLFSKNPISPETNTMVMEGSKKSRAVVDGSDPDVRFELPKSENFFADDPSWLPIYKQIFEVGLKLEHKFGYPIDMEWAIKGNDVFILQVRPIKIRQNNLNKRELMICSLDDRAQCEKLDLKGHGYEEFWIRFVNKKYWIRKKARSIGAHSYAEFFVRFTPELIEEASQKLGSIELGSEYMVVRYPGMQFSQKYYHRTMIIEALRELIVEKPNQPEYLIQIGEFIPVEIAGYSTLLQNATIYIEYVPGLASGIISGEFSPSKIIVDQLGSIIHEDLTSFPEIYVFDEGKKEKVKVSNSNEHLCTLPPFLITQIIQSTIEFSKLLKEPRLEWYFYKEKYYIKDLSMENNPVSFSNDIGIIMSSGFAEGSSLLLTDEDLECLDQLGESLNISVISRSEEEDDFIINETEYKNRTLIRKLSEASNMIVIATRPSTGFIPFLDNINGFIFNQGSLLSHLGIVLREKEIPAVISNSIRDYRENEYVSISSETGISKSKSEGYI